MSLDRKLSKRHFGTLHYITTARIKELLRLKQTSSRDSNLFIDWLGYNGDRWGEYMTMRELAQKYSISTTRVSQIVNMMHHKFSYLGGDK